MVILTKDEIYEIDSIVLATGTSLPVLIGSVGKELANWFVAQQLLQKKILILCGPGNNGGDGLALAQALRELGCQVGIFVPDRSAILANEILKTFFLAVEDLHIDQSQLADFDCYVDGLFGIGLTRSPSGAFGELITKVNQQSGLKVAIDIPSGVDANLGKIYEPCFKADHTLTVSCLKRGLVLLPGREMTGEITVIPVASLDKELKRKDYFCKTLEPKPAWRRQLTPGKESHKYNRGKVTIVMGGKFPGAALLAAQAARNCGAGYTQIYCPQALLAESQIQNPGIVFHEYGDENDLARQLREDNSQVVVMGPGWHRPFNVALILDEQKVFVFDGGLLQAQLLTEIKGLATSQIVLTPHSGELTRMVGEPLSKWEALELLAKNFSGVVIAKGFDTVVYQAQGEALLTVDNSPFLATAGSGDVLAGLVGGLCSQGLAPIEASACAVYLHQYAAAAIGYGTTAEKLIAEIPKVISQRLPT